MPNARTHYEDKIKKGKYIAFLSGLEEKERSNI